MDHAEVRAARRLKRFLSEDQIETWRQHGYVDVQSAHHPGRRYRIPARPDVDLVWMYEEDRVAQGLCVQPEGQRLLAADLVLMHKLYIQADEERYLLAARRYPAASITELARLLREAGRARDLSLLPSIFD